MAKSFAYVHPVAQGSQLLLECIDNSLSSSAAVWNFDTVGGTSRKVYHVLKGRVFESLNWL
jgi:hypothetical protein